MSVLHWAQNLTVNVNLTINLTLLGPQHFMRVEMSSTQDEILALLYSQGNSSHWSSDFMHIRLLEFGNCTL